MALAIYIFVLLIVGALAQKYENESIHPSIYEYIRQLNKQCNNNKHRHMATIENFANLILHNWAMTHKLTTFLKVKSKSSVA